LRALLDGLLDALQTLHDAGVLHGDVTPNHILLLPDDRPLLMDSSAERRAIVGNEARALMSLLAPAFAPMEQTVPELDKPQGPWTDLYALAGVIKYCISGELPPPFSLYRLPSRETMSALLQRLRPQFPELHFSSSFVRTIDTALASRPQDRLQSVAEFRAMLNDHPPSQIDVLALPEAADVPVSHARREPTLEPPIAPASPVAAPASPPGEFNASRSQPLPRGHTSAADIPQVFGPRSRSRRRRGRWAWATAALVVVAAGAGAWLMLDHQRVMTMAQAALARAARQDGLMANVPVVPRPPSLPASQAEQSLLPAAPQDAAAPVGAVQPGVATNLQTEPPPVISSAGTESALPAAANSSTAALAPAGDALSISPTQAQAASSQPMNAVPAAASAAPAAELSDPRAAPRRDDPAESTSVDTSGVRSEGTPQPETLPHAPARNAAAAQPALLPRQVSGPREACGDRTQFALYRCMKTQCEQERWIQHPACKRLRERDDVD
jgi:non-specific serine/threonine protein kinase